MKKNKRKHPRRSTSVPTHVSYLSNLTGALESTVGETKDLSRGGARLKIRRVSVIEEIQEITLRPPGHTKRIKTNGEMRWSSEQEEYGFVGVRFTSLSSDAQEIIENCLGYGKSVEIIEKSPLVRFQQIKSKLTQLLNLSESEQKRINNIHPSNIYSCSEIFDIGLNQLAELIASYVGMEYVSERQSKTVKIHHLPPQFCQKHTIVPVRTEEDNPELVLSNPFKHLFHTAFHNYHGGTFERFSIASPETICELLREKYNTGSLNSGSSSSLTGPFVLHVGSDGNKNGSPFSLQSDSSKGKKLNSVSLKDRSSTVDQFISNLLASMIKEDVDTFSLRLEETELDVRLRSGSESNIHLTLPCNLIRALIIRIKILAGLDITNRWSSQHGGFPIIHFSTRYKIRVSINAGLGKGTASVQVLED